MKCQGAQKTANRTLVTLYVRVWIEIFYKNIPSDNTIVTLYVRVWIEIKRRS